MTAIAHFTEVDNNSASGARCKREALASLPLHYEATHKVFADGLRKLVQDNSGVFCINISAATYPKGYIPSEDFLKSKARYYREKYGIYIELAPMDSLSDALTGLRGQETHPPYVGVMVTYPESKHITPLLLKIGKQGYRIVVEQCLCMDVMQNTDLGRLEEFIQMQYKITPSQIIRALEHHRQIDFHSCRTGGLLLLRNTLLDLQSSGRTELFMPASSSPSIPSSGLRTRFAPKKYDLSLPPQWTYGEQIFFGKDTGPIIRDLYSKQVKKRTSPRSIASFRASHTEKLQYRATITASDDFSPWLRDVPEGIDPKKLESVIEVHIPANTYLQKKAMRWALLT